MLSDRERSEIARLWHRKLDQEARGLPQADRHRNLEPDAAELICALASAVGAKRMVEVGGSSGISTIALAGAARATGGRLTSIEIEPIRHIISHGLTDYVAHVRRQPGAESIMLSVGKGLEVSRVRCA